MKVCAVIPVYNHGEAVGAVVQAVRATRAAVLVDDGSEPGCAQVLDTLAQGTAPASAGAPAQNEGKGGR